MRESQFWALIKDKLPGHVERMENAVAKGTPDVNLCYEGHEVWIELKVLEANGNFKKGDPSPEQLIWHMKRQVNGGRCFVVGRNEKIIKLCQVQRDRTVFELWTCNKPFNWPTFLTFLFHTPPFCTEMQFDTTGDKQ